MTVEGNSQRVTISDIAREAAVAPSTVSYALNGRPGVGEATRQRILAVAAGMGWHPNTSARALRSERTRTVGLMLRRRLDQSQEQQSSFLLNFIIGIETELSINGFTMLLHTVPDADAEVAEYARWWVERRVDGVIVYNPLVDDPRPPQLQRLELPAVVVGDVDHFEDIKGLARVWTDSLDAAALAVDHLFGLGHQRIARVGVNPSFMYTQTRRRGFERAMAAAGLPSDLSVEAEQDAAVATAELLRRPDPPTAIIYEADTIAIEGILALRSRGLAIPGDVSVVAWDDCTMYRLLSPPLTALHRNVPSLGRAVAKTLLATLSGGEPIQLQGARTQLLVRGSTAPPKSRPTAF